MVLETNTVPTWRRPILQEWAKITRLAQALNKYFLTVGRPIPQLRAIFLSLRPLANFKRNTSFILRMDNLFVGISIPLNIEKDQDAGLVILRRTHLPEN